MKIDQVLFFVDPVFSCDLKLDFEVHIDGSDVDRATTGA